MNNIKKTVLGMAIAAFTFGISAYATIKNRAVLRYYKTDTRYPANNPDGYYYYSGDRCETGGNLCSAEWDIGANTAPIDGDPLPADASFQGGSVMPGHFE